ncbi:VF530 family DNA-binding protein [Reinekea sp. G2M2-21]|uniref:VF530 family protein n=1 Tax=Reinekea sp. G2M2-21 TaxID=2788942 RepID=UPI0018ABAE92|nr:VF530 family protein [Reinekea sp. G2M2-21]
MTNDPLHGVTLKALVTELVDFYGFEQLGQHINIRCFTHDPSINSSLKVLRKTPWARAKVEAFYIEHQARAATNPWLSNTTAKGK